MRLGAATSFATRGDGARCSKTDNQLQTPKGPTRFSDPSRMGGKMWITLRDFLPLRICASPGRT
eukprot:5530219-Alexandrium_andersonii.AAC.1